MRVFSSTSSRTPWEHHQLHQPALQVCSWPGEESIGSLGFLKVFVCVPTGVHVCTYACVHMITCVHMMMWRPEVDMVCFPRLLSILIFFPIYLVVLVSAHACPHTHMHHGTHV